jgi:hypothetical protein
MFDDRSGALGGGRVANGTGGGGTNGTGGGVARGAGGGGEEQNNATHVSRDWRAIDRRMRQLAARRAALDVEEARMLLLAKRLEIHRYLGYGSFAEYIERVLGYAPNTGRDRVRVAEELEELPAIATAWEEGRLTYSAVREMTRVATPETEDVVVAYCDGLTVREVVDAMRGLEKGDDPRRQRHPELEPRRLRMELPPETYALFLEARRWLEREVGHAMDDAQFMAVACRAVLDGGARGADHPDSQRESAEHGALTDEVPSTARAKPPAGPRHQIAIIVCEQCRRGWHDVPGQSVEITAAALERARCDAIELGRVDVGAAAPAPARRSIAANTRRAVLARDHHRCRVPGCRMSRFVDVHHIVHVENGGGPEMWNLVTLCELHHSMHHDGRIVIAGTADALVVAHADGRPYGAVPGAATVDARPDTDARAVVELAATQERM